MYEIQVLEPAEVIAGSEYPAEWTTIDRKASRTFALASVIRLCGAGEGEYRVVSRGVVTVESKYVRQTIAARQAWEASR